jgi:hypothetical protein
MVKAIAVNAIGRNAAMRTGNGPGQPLQSLLTSEVIAGATRT